MRILKTLTLIGLCVGLLAACQTAPAPSGEPAPAPARGGSTVTGTVTLPAGASSGSGTVLEVRLIEASRGVGAATLIASERINNPGPSPMRYTIRYDAGRISPDSVYLVEAFVYENGLLRFTNNLPFQVLTLGFDNTADIRVFAVPLN